MRVHSRRQSPVLSSADGALLSANISKCDQHITGEKQRLAEPEQHLQEHHRDRVVHCSCFVPAAKFIGLPRAPFFLKQRASNLTGEARTNNSLKLLTAVSQLKRGSEIGSLDCQQRISLKTHTVLP